MHIKDIAEDYYTLTNEETDESYTLTKQEVAVLLTFRELHEQGCQGSNTDELAEMTGLTRIEMNQAGFRLLELGLVDPPLAIN
jgi:DNA-binding MarR family transcriptional regulator